MLHVHGLAPAHMSSRIGVCCSLTVVTSPALETLRLLSALLVALCLMQFVPSLHSVDALRRELHR